MKPEYEHFRRLTGDPGVDLSARIHPDLKRDLERVAAAEGDTVTGIIIEGAARVLEDRGKIPRYTDPAVAARRRVEVLEEQLEQAKIMKEYHERNSS